MAESKSIEELVYSGYTTLLAVQLLCDSLASDEVFVKGGPDDRLRSFAFAVGRLVEPGMGDVDVAHGRLCALRLDSASASAAVLVAEGS